MTSLRTLALAWLSLGLLACFQPTTEGGPPDAAVPPSTCGVTITGAVAAQLACPTVSVTLPPEPGGRTTAWLKLEQGQASLSLAVEWDGLQPPRGALVDFQSGASGFITWRPDDLASHQRTFWIAVHLYQPREGRAGGGALELRLGDDGELRGTASLELTELGPDGLPGATAAVRATVTLP